MTSISNPPNSRSSSSLAKLPSYQTPGSFLSTCGETPQSNANTLSMRSECFKSLLEEIKQEFVEKHSNHTKYSLSGNLEYDMDEDGNIHIKNGQVSVVIPFPILKQAIDDGPDNINKDAINKFITQFNSKDKMFIPLDNEGKSFVFSAESLEKKETKHLLFIKDISDGDILSLKRIALTDGDARFLRRLIRAVE